MGFYLLRVNSANCYESKSIIPLHNFLYRAVYAEAQENADCWKHALNALFQGEVISRQEFKSFRKDIGELGNAYIPIEHFALLFLEIGIEFKYHFRSDLHHLKSADRFQDHIVDQLYGSDVTDDCSTWIAFGPPQGILGLLLCYRGHYVGMPLCSEGYYFLDSMEAGKPHFHDGLRPLTWQEFFDRFFDKNLICVIAVAKAEFEAVRAHVKSRWSCPKVGASSNSCVPPLAPTNGQHRGASAPQFSPADAALHNNLDMDFADNPTENDVHEDELSADAEGGIFPV